MNKDLICRVALTLVPGIGPLIAKTLTEYLGSAEAVFNTKAKDLEELPGVRKALSQSIFQNKDEVLKRAEKEITFITKNNIQTLFYQDENYPQRLKTCDDAPYMMFYKGSGKLNHSKIISIVGSRKCTEYGVNLTHQLVKDLAEYNILVVSGLAYGIDAEAHKACLENQLETVGVLGHGLDLIYPSQHRAIAAKMVERGGLLTEFLSETNPDYQNFPKRNRIVAGMSDATIVIESAAKGGSLITADIAHSYSREVFAFPGRTFDKASAGCNQLIKSQKAMMIENAQDLISAMDWEGGKKEKQLQLSLDKFSDPEQKILSLISAQNSVHVDVLAINTGLTLPQLKNHLFQLEMRGVIKNVPGNRVQLMEVVF